MSLKSGWCLDGFHGSCPHTFPSIEGGPNYRDCSCECHTESQED